MNPYLAIAAYIALAYTVGYLTLINTAERTCASGRYDPDDTVFAACCGLLWPLTITLAAIWWTFSVFVDVLDKVRDRRNRPPKA